MLSITTGAYTFRYNKINIFILDLNKIIIKLRFLCKKIEFEYELNIVVNVTAIFNIHLIL